MEDTCVGQDADKRLNLPGAPFVRMNAFTNTDSEAIQATLGIVHLSAMPEYVKNVDETLLSRSKPGVSNGCKPLGTFLSKRFQMPGLVKDGPEA